MLTSLLYFSGRELANHTRWRAHMVNGLGTQISIRADHDCTTITPVDPGPYTLPNTAGSEAPWYNATRPESAHYAGMFVERITGFDDPYLQRDVEDGIVGGVLGGLNLGPRTLTVTAQLYGLSTFGLDYGLEWVTALLAGKESTSTLFCNLGDLEFYATCPDPARGAECVGTAVPVIDETALDIRRTGFSGGLVQGPRVIDRLYDGNRVVAYRISFTIGLEVPWFAGAATDVIAATALNTNPAAVTEVYVCPGFVDPCPPATAAELAADVEFACPTFVEQTCDWANAYAAGPTSWATQTWTATGEEVLELDGGPCTMVLSRSGDPAVDGCARPSVRMAFATATGGTGPISVEFNNTAGQGNLNIQLWDPATDTNLAISTIEKPASSPGYRFTTPTGDAYNLGNQLSVGRHKLDFDLPTGVDPGTLLLIVSAFGGGSVSNPVTETLSEITLNYRRPTIVAACCSLEPGQPIVDTTYQVPCYTVPATSHRLVNVVANSSTMNEQALRFVFTNPSGTPVVNTRVAVYDPTLIGLAAGTAPTAAGVWPNGIQEWECNALVGEFYLPEIPAGTIVDIDGRKRKATTSPAADPNNAKAGDRWFYGGGSKPWMFDPVPAGASRTVVVFADPTVDPAATVAVTASTLHLTKGAAV